MSVEDEVGNFPYLLPSLKESKIPSLSLKIQEKRKNSPSALRAGAAKAIFCLFCLGFSIDIVNVFFSNV